MSEQYRVNGKLHREDGPAFEHHNGTKHWHLNGNLHREDGPAVENPNGTKHWYLNGKYHREDGPAIEYSSGVKYWYLHGENLSEKQWLAATNPTKELTVAEISKLLGYTVKVVE